MTKKELLQAFDAAIEATEAHVITGLESTDIAQAEKDKHERLSFLKQARRDIDNLLKFLDDTTDLNSLSMVSHCDSPKSLQDFLQTKPFPDMQYQVLKMQGKLETFAEEKGKQLQKIKDAQSQSESLNFQQKQSATTRRKHSKGSKWLFGGILLFIGVVIALLAVYFTTMEEPNEHAIVDFALLGIGLGVDIFALIREILNDKKQQCDDAELLKQCEKLVGDLTVIQTIEDRRQQINIHSAKNIQVGNKNTQINK